MVSEDAWTENRGWGWINKKEEDCEGVKEFEFIQKDYHDNP
jgi:hypothetical protein